MTDQPSASEVPIWPHFVPHVLQVLADGTTHHRRDLIELVFQSIGLSDAGRDEMLSSGISRATNRVGWTLSHLSKAGWVERPERARYRITPDGRAWLDTNPGAELGFSEAHTLFREFWPQTATSADATAPAVSISEPSDLPPTEQVESGIARLRADVAEELLERLQGSDPTFFEDAVVKVLLAMGYGGAEQRGRRIGGSGDGGVDGVIDQDALGLEQIYIQAKRYATGNTVGREAIQAFIGALHGFGASRGIFLTTSTFTQNARTYADQIPTRVVLIDGQRLVSLMITYRVGVQIRQTYEVVEVDEDFFD